MDIKTVNNYSLHSYIEFSKKVNLTLVDTGILDLILDAPWCSQRQNNPFPIISGYT
jgi:hypothetical protein